MIIHKVCWSLGSLWTDSFRLRKIINLLISMKCCNRKSTKIFIEEALSGLVFRSSWMVMNTIHHIRRVDINCRYNLDIFLKFLLFRKDRMLYRMVGHQFVPYIILTLCRLFYAASIPTIDISVYSNGADKEIYGTSLIFPSLKNHWHLSN